MVELFQIVPKEVKDRNVDSEMHEPENRSGVEMDRDRRPMMSDDAIVSAATLHQTKPRRELPRIATNGTLTRPGNGSGNPAGKRRLPERSLPVAPPEQVHGYPPPGVRLFRSNLPRPAPVVHQFAQSRVPLPPVPELDRSDAERESMSPVPPEPRNLRLNAPKPKSLPSPLVTP